MKAVITGVGHYVPPERLTNSDLEKRVDTTNEWIITRTGIRERRILSEGKGTSCMAVEAAKNVLNSRRISPDELDLIILATVTPDMPVPSAVALVQKELNAHNCWGFDLNGGCSGFLYALMTGAQFIESGRHNKVLILGADKMSSIIDYQDRNTCVLFGDGAGAVLLEPDKSDQDLGIHDFELHLDGEGSRYLYIAAGGSLRPASKETVEKREHYVFQDGRSVFKSAVNSMTDVCRRIIERNNLKEADVKLLIPHQANIRIIESVANKLKIENEKVMINIGNYGNTTAATIPIAMSEAVMGHRLKRGDWVILTAFGAGFTWGSVLLKWGME